jgi:hypothetical protein
VGRRVLFPLLALALSLVATAALVEVAFRIANPPPRAQVIRLEGHLHAFEHDGVTLYWDDEYGDGPVRGGPCRPGQRVVGVFGDSVQVVSGPEFDLPRTATLLQDRLRADGFDACVLDTSWAGWKPDQVVAMLRRTHAETPVDVAVVGVWKNDQRYVRVGDLLIDGETVAHDAHGVPLPPLPLPGALHRALLGASTAWRYATLALDGASGPDRPLDLAYRDALAWSEGAHVPLVFLEGVFLDRPFATSRQERADHPDTWQARLRASAEAAGHGWVYLADAFADLDVERVRLDACCHFDVHGHRVAADALAPLVEAALVAQGKGPTVAVTSPGTAPR